MTQKLYICDKHSKRNQGNEQYLIICTHGLHEKWDANGNAQLLPHSMRGWPCLRSGEPKLCTTRAVCPPSMAHCFNVLCDSGLLQPYILATTFHSSPTWWRVKCKTNRVKGTLRQTWWNSNLKLCCVVPYLPNSNMHLFSEEISLKILCTLKLGTNWKCPMAAHRQRHYVVVATGNHDSAFPCCFLHYRSHLQSGAVLPLFDP